MLNKKWLTSGIAAGAFIAVLGFWEWGAALFAFCLTASWSQGKLDRLSLRQRAEKAAQ